MQQSCSGTKSVLQARPCRLVLVSELEWLLVAFDPKQCVLGLICNVATLSGDNKLETCSVVHMGRTVQCWSMVRLVLQMCFVSKTCNWNPGDALGCFFNPIAVWDFGRFAMQPCPGGQLCLQQVGNLQCQCSMAQPFQVTAFLGKKLETCSFSAACCMGRTVQHG